MYVHQNKVRKELASYHQKYYAPNNATACIVGNVDIEQVKKMAKKYFGKIKAQEPPNPVETREPEQKGERRVIVEHERIDDKEAMEMASEMAKKIEAELEYPGQIRVTVIRETRAVDYAK